MKVSKMEPVLTPVPLGRFRRHRATIDGRAFDYWLADQPVRLEYGPKGKRKRLSLRQVTRLSESGHQTPILTSRRDLCTLEVAYRMFDRWGQENFFKYLREEFALDALVDYGTEPADATRDVPNPERRKLDAELHQARAHLEQLQAHYGLAALENRERRRPTMRGFKIANAELSARVRQAMRRIHALETKRATLPTRVPVQEVVGADVVKLAVERKHLTDLLKMVAYQAEGDLVRLLAPHYRRAEHEGRTLIHTALAAGGQRGDALPRVRDVTRRIDREEPVVDRTPAHRQRHRRPRLAPPDVVHVHPAALPQGALLHPHRPPPTALLHVLRHHERTIHTARRTL